MPSGRVATATRVTLALASIAIAFAAADTYVVVLALPDMMTAAGLPINELQRAAPIISGFLLGYVAVLPLIGRISDLRGRVPVLTASLAIFAIGSVITATAYNLDSVVVGRLIQGIGAGGTIPPTLALVADVWPPHRRGLPLGLVGAVQELGSVAGPVLGAVILAVGDWRAIFWFNCAIGLVLAAALIALPHEAQARRRVASWDWLSAGLMVAILAAISLVMLQPTGMAQHIDWGRLFIAVWSESRWLTPLAVCAYVLAVALLVRWWTAKRPLVDVRAWPEIARQCDLVGSAALAIALGAVIVTFASSEPERAAVSDQAPALLGVAALALAAFAWRQRTTRQPLIPRGALSTRAAWGSLVVSFFIGSALIAALTDIPLFARLTVHRDSQVDAAMVLVEFLIALPVGALLGGVLIRRVPAHLVAALGMACAAVALWFMASWSASALTEAHSTVVLVAGGLGFGLAIAPVNAVLLAHTASAVHGVASALLIVARTIGMLVGISALTSLGLRALHAAIADIGSVSDVCGTATMCQAYTDAQLDAALSQLHTIFWGAAACAAVAAIASLALLRVKATTHPSGTLSGD